MPFDGVPNSPARDLILRAREILQDPERWCQGASHRGVARCVWGAVFLNSESAIMTRIIARSALHATAIIWGYPSIGAFNDDRCTTHGDVLRFLTVAADRASKVCDAV